MGVDNATYHGKEPDAGSCDGGTILRLVQAVRQQLTDQIRQTQGYEHETQQLRE